MKPEKREKIMRAAEALFSRGRFHEVTMEDVARRAGVGKGTLYRYFKDKDDLFLEVALSGYDDLCSMVRARTAAAGDFRTCLLDACARISEFHRSRRQLMGMMQAEERRALHRRGRARERWMARRRQLIDALGAVLNAGRDEQAIRPDVPVEALASCLLGLLRVRGHSARSGAAVLTHETLVDLFLNGAGLRNARGGSRP